MFSFIMIMEVNYKHMKNNIMEIFWNLNIGDRIVVPKSFIKWVQHHAIYLGWEKGHHWIIENKEGIGVRVVTATDFFKDVIEITRIEKFKPSTAYSRRHLKDFALSKIEDEYSLLNYNCESFANLIQYGKATSSQVSTGISLGVIGITAVLAGLLYREG